MANSPKFHKKLNNPKHATVSLECLLGLLSSAYGTEELDCKTIFENKYVNLRNLSVENVKTDYKKDLHEPSEIKRKNKEYEKINAATSTTNLNPIRNSGSDIDITLISVKSLRELEESDKNSQVENCTTNEINETSNSQENMIEASTDLGVNPNEKQVDLNSKLFEDRIECDDIKVQQETICGFFVDDANHTIIFDIQFSKKIRDDELFSVLNIDEPEISIDLTDTHKLSKLHLKVAKSHLVSKSHYLAHVDKEFGLENLEVAVKCNVQVFNWILQWIQEAAEIPMSKPKLNANNLKLIIPLAYHLGIEQLVDECLDYFYNYHMIVLELDCGIQDIFDDDLFSKLVKRFKNSDIENIDDKFLGFKIKMFCALIELLGNETPLSIVGHYSTVANIFQCGHCEKLLNPDVMDFLPCRSDCNQLNFKGELISYHERSPFWDFSKYIELMYDELGSWQLVYWRLWGICHFLKCDSCQMFYPLCQSEWCCYHDDEVTYFPIDSRLSYPIGTYKCCGEITFRFNVLHLHSGCKFRSHKPCLDSENDFKMYDIYKAYKNFINYQPPKCSVMKKFTKLLKNNIINDEQSEVPTNLWWKGVRLVPKEKKDYSMISTYILNQLRNKSLEEKVPPSFKPLNYESKIHVGLMPSSTSCLILSSESSEDTVGTVQSNKCTSKINTKKSISSNILPSVKIKPKKKKFSTSYEPAETLWQASESNKNNQDTQRDFEEIAMRILVKMLTPEDSVGVNPQPAAGTYVRLESDWWQERFKDSKNSGNHKVSGTVINRTFPRSWFRRLTI